MNGFKKCSNGHFYKEDLNACPYCPGGNSGSTGTSGADDLGRTMVTNVNQGGGSGDAKTEVFGSGAAADGDKTQVYGNAGNSGASSAPKRDLNRTFIAGIEETESASGEVGAIKSEPRATRRIVGWIISYDLDPMGVDYRIYEGTNTIGRDPKNTIIITKDTTISSEHVTIPNDTQETRGAPSMACTHPRRHFSPPSMVNNQQPLAVQPSTTRLFTTKPLVWQYDELLTPSNTPPDLGDLCFLHSQLLFAAKVSRFRGLADASVSRVLEEAESFRLRCRRGPPAERLSPQEERRLQTAIDEVLIAPTTTPRSQHLTQGGLICPLLWHSSFIPGGFTNHSEPLYYIDDATYPSVDTDDNPEEIGKENDHPFWNRSVGVSTGPRPAEGGSTASGAGSSTTSGSRAA